jgi:hypothetical protein
LLVCLDSFEVGGRRSSKPVSFSKKNYDPKLQMLKKVVPDIEKDQGLLQKRIEWATEH